MIPWLIANFKNFKPTAAIAINATRHMNRIERKKLFSPDIEPMRTAEGRWFEAIVYEMFLDISKKSPGIKYLARKGADAPNKREDVRIGQNGLFYSKYGDITIRGNGQDLAEFDLLLVDSDNLVAFGEVVTSPADLKEFEAEIAYKKRLLGYLYNQKSTPFLLISSFDLSNYSVVKRLAKDKTNAIIHTSTCEEIKSLVKHYRPRIIYDNPVNHQKLIPATEIPMKQPFDYKRFHDEVRATIFTRISEPGARKFPEITTPTGQLVKKVLYGGLYPPAIRALCEVYGLSVKGKRIEYSEFSKFYSKAIIATDLPGTRSLFTCARGRKKNTTRWYSQRTAISSSSGPLRQKSGFFSGWMRSSPRSVHVPP